MSPQRALGLLFLMLSACSPEAELPRRYRELRVPEGFLASAEARAAGAELFAANCALCHGERGDGRGARRSSLSTSPADLTHPGWQRRTSPRRLFYLIREGKPGTAMPAWKSLSEEETWALVAYVKSLAPPAETEASR
jgi:mono/diheme cytochrome c family protein